jgi:hypothetical protein
MSVKVLVSRQEAYAPHVEDYLEILLPTEMVRSSGAVRRKSIPAGTFVALASYKIGAGSVLRLANLSMMAGSASVWNLRGAFGTLYYYLEAAGGVHLLGQQLAPVHVVTPGGGTYFRVGPFGTFGACTGTIRYLVTFEGMAVQRRPYGSAPSAPT